MGSQDQGSMWWNVPQLRLEDHLLLANRVKALEEWCDHLETLILKHRRDVRSHVPRETEALEDLDENSIYYQTVIDFAAPEAGVGSVADDRSPGDRPERGAHE